MIGITVDVTGTSIIIRLLDVDYCSRLHRAFRAIMLGVNADAQHITMCDHTLLLMNNEIGQSILRTYMALWTSFSQSYVKVQNIWLYYV